jgi:hypothetical protein
MKQPQKIYAPVTEFERQTSYCPLYLAWRILDEARNYFQTPIPEAFADKIAHRAEAVFARHPFWARKATPRARSCKASNFAEASMDRSPRDEERQFQSQRQREFILTSMRHWLAGVLAKERPALFRDLPESFKLGQPLPMKPNPWRGSPGVSPHQIQKIMGRKPGLSRPVSRFVHGCELLPA